MRQISRKFSIRSFVNALAKLPSLKVLRLVSLGLWGPLPEAVSSLTDLQTLVLNGNRLTGRIPDGLGSLSVLAVLSLKSNSLDGHLPDTLRDLNNLRVLSLSKNNFSGDVPDQRKFSPIISLNILIFLPTTLWGHFLRRCYLCHPSLIWTQRIAAATGVAKGLQFLHNGIIPGLFSNNLKITDILLDQNLVAKISSYNLPVLTENIGKEYCQIIPVGYNQREKYEEKLDVYDFGVILLEIITGRPIKTKNDILLLRNQLQASMTGNGVNVVDLAIRRSSCSSESLRTMIEMCCRCLYEDPVDRPSMEDLLWNLQFAAQVQDDYHSSDASPISPIQRSGQLVIQ